LPYSSKRTYLQTNNQKEMTPAQKITDLKILLAEAKEALMNRDPKTREKECYDSGTVPCVCTLCKINEALIASIEKTYFEVFQEGKAYNLHLIGAEHDAHYIYENGVFKGYDIYTKKTDEKRCKLFNIDTARPITSMDY
jgi:hypothetical protein